MSDLSIVVLAYKSEYLSQTLLSITSQSQNDFSLFVLNDNSPDPQIEIIVDASLLGYKYYYEKFAENLGGSNLIAHWNRCILKTSTEYVWLICDDDIIPYDAVERFYSFIEVQNCPDLLRFNLSVIDKNSNLIYDSPEHPFSETSHEFAIRRLTRNCTSSLSEHIFSRKVFNRTNGFVNLPLAWASDDATWIKFGLSTDIKTIPGLPVQWRNDGQNISSDISRGVKKSKIQASYLFVLFTTAYLNIPNSLLIDWLKFQYSLVGIKKSTFSICFNFISIKYLKYYLKLKNERESIYNSI